MTDIAPHPVFITVLVPTFNRKDELCDLFRSLLNQTCRDFEWLVVDDGSTDGSEEAIRSWARDASFPVRIIQQANQGKHVAVNNGFRHAAGLLTMTLDSDDMLVPDAIEFLKQKWTHYIREDSPGDICGISGLFQYEDGSTVGSPYPESEFISDFWTVRNKLRVTGDKKEVVLTALARQYPYEVFVGEKRMPPSLLWYRLAREYKAIFCNKTLAVKRYMGQGWSKNIHAVKAKSCRGQAFYHETLLRLYPDEMSYSNKARMYANLLRYNLHAGARLFAGWDNIAWRLFCLPLAITLFLRDIVLVKKQRFSSPAKDRGNGWGVD